MPEIAAEVIAAIEGASRLIDRFGIWPTFDDWEVISLRLNRGNAMKVFETKAWKDLIHPALDAEFYGFDSRYGFSDANRKPTLIKIEFGGTFERFSLDRFNHQNPITGLEIIFEYSENLKRNLFAVDWAGAGHEVSFTCARIEVLSVEALSAA